MTKKAVVQQVVLVLHYYALFVITICACVQVHMCVIVFYSFFHYSDVSLSRIAILDDCDETGFIEKWVNTRGDRLAIDLCSPTSQGVIKEGKKKDNFKGHLFSKYHCYSVGQCSPPVLIIVLQPQTLFKQPVS